MPAPDDGVAPAAPQHLTATAGTNRVTLGWDPNSETDVVGYHVYRSTTTPVPTTGTPLSGTGPVTGTTYLDTTATGIPISGTNSTATPNYTSEVDFIDSSSTTTLSGASSLTIFPKNNGWTSNAPN